MRRLSDSLKDVFYSSYSNGDLNRFVSDQAGDDSDSLKQLRKEVEEYLEFQKKINWDVREIKYGEMDITFQSGQDTTPKITNMIKQFREYEGIKQLKKIREIIDKKLEVSRETPEITKKDVIFKFLEFRDKGIKTTPAVQKTRDWLSSNNIDPDNTKALYGITISEISPDNFRRTADNYQVEYMREKRKNSE